MTPGHVDYVIPQGTTWRLRLIFTIDDVPVDLTGWSARMEIRDPEAEGEGDDDAAALLVSTPGDGIVLSAVPGAIDLELTVDQTRDLEVPIDPKRVWPQAKVYVHDLELTDPSGAVSRLVEGRATVTREVTR